MKSDPKKLGKLLMNSVKSRVKKPRLVSHDSLHENNSKKKSA